MSKINFIIALFETEDNYKSYIKEHGTVIIKTRKKRLFDSANNDPVIELKIDTFELKLKYPSREINITLDYKNSVQMNAIKTDILRINVEEMNTLIYMHLTMIPSNWEIFFKEIDELGCEVSFKDNPSEGAVILYKNNLNKIDPVNKLESRYSNTIKFVMTKDEFNRLTEGLFEKGWIDNFMGYDGGWLGFPYYQIGKSIDELIYEKDLQKRTQVKSEYKLDYELESKKINYNYLNNSKNKKDV